MLRALFRVSIGFVVACFAAGITQVLFVMTPAQLAVLPHDVAANRISTGFVWALAIGTQSAIFAAPFAAALALLAEFTRIRSTTYFITAGIVIALLGFFTQYAGEAGTGPSIANNYALLAFLTTGFVAGLVYWMAAGRKSGRFGRLDRDRDRQRFRADGQRIETRLEPVRPPATGLGNVARDRARDITKAAPAAEARQLGTDLTKAEPVAVEALKADVGEATANATASKAGPDKNDAGKA